MVKIKSVLFAGLFLLVAPAFAQLSIGPRIGTTFTKVDLTDERFDVTANPGMTAALMVEWEVNKHFSLQPEILWNQRKYEQAYAGVSRSYSLNYLEIPVLAKVKFGPENFRFFLQGGPTYSYALDGMYQSANESNENEVIFGEDNFSRNEIGVQLGGGLAVKAGMGRIVADVRLGAGFTKNQDLMANSVFTQRYRGLMASVGYVIPLF
ncbi:MAG: PorT family protein [Bacteroidetes bacterium]|nr:MAG: PorT family protein [Bacteroidota bacterium]